MLPEVSAAVLVFSGVGFAVLLAIPSATAGSPPEDRLAKVIKEKQLPVQSLLQWRSIIVHSLSNPAALLVFGVLYLVASIFILLYYSFPGLTCGDTVAKTGLLITFGTTIGVTIWIIVVPVKQYIDLKWAAKVLEKLR